MKKQPKFLSSLVFIGLTYNLLFPRMIATITSEKPLVSQLTERLIAFNSRPMAAMAASPAEIQPSEDATGQSETASEINLVTVTAYSSTADQTDATPFITASGEKVKDGIVACNFLPFGTKIKFPDLYGDKIFIVKDRMARKNSHKIDIWFPTTEQAIKFGVKKTRIEILVAN